MEKIPGCWEHLSMVWHALKEARAQKSNLAIIWLDIANTYGSIPHKLIAFVLHRYGVSPQWIRRETYYKGIFSKSFSESANSAWHRHQQGIFAGCTLSIILFLAGMNIILEYSMQPRVPKFTTNNTTLPLLCAFMDDLSLMSTKVPGAQTLLSRCITALTWAGLEFRADKSRSIVIVKGRSMNTTPFSFSKASVQPEVPSLIPSIHSRPIKFLGRIIDGSISNRNSSAELKDKLLAGLSVIDRSHYTGTQKVWILQHLLIPRIQWPLLIYEIPISLAFKLEQKVSMFIRKWLHLHHSTSSFCFYSSASPCPLPIKSLSSAPKTSKISGHLLLRNSQDPLASSCVPKLRNGTWKVEDAVLSCENDIKISQVCGNCHHNKHGLGYTTTPKLPKNQSSKHYRRYISDHHKTIDDTYAFSKAVQLQVQGQWTRWINYVQQDFSWSSLMAMQANLTSFCLASTYDTLPSPTNLKRWRITTEAWCTLCSKDVCTTADILGACKVVLQQGRYTFRHDTVLHQVIEALQTFISNIKEAVPISTKSSIMFVKKGAKLRRKRTPPVGILHYASDWVLLADLNSNYCFPVHIAFTQLRPDIIIFSNSLRKVILIELTCPSEENMQSWDSTKINKYLALKTVIESNGWCVELFAVGFGARGYCSKSVLCCFKKLAFNNTRIRNTIKKIKQICYGMFFLYLAGQKQ